MERDEELWGEPKQPAFKASTLALGFVAFGLFATLFGVPLAQQHLSAPAVGVDTIVTGSTPQVRLPSTESRYFVRRSVLQKSPGSECRIYLSGRREGDC